MPGRKYTATVPYRYGYNGMESDKEVRGEGNALDFGSRSIYDPRLMRFVSVDPRSRDYAGMSPYLYAGNNPIFFNDEDGEGPIPFRFKSWLKADSWYVTGLLYGIGDGLIETVDAAAGLAKATLAMSPVIPGPLGLPVPNFYYYTNAAKQTRIEIGDFANAMQKLATDKGMQAKVIGQLKSALGDWWDDVAFKNSPGEAGYAHGKLLFDLVSTFIGVGELKALFKTGQLSANAFSKISSLSKIERIIVQKNGVWKKLTDLPIQTHHVLTKYGEWGKRFNKVLGKYGLDVDGDFNKLKLHHQGPHPESYHQEMYRRLLEIDKEAKGDKTEFLKLYKEKISDYVQQNPEIINNNYKIVGNK